MLFRYAVKNGLEAVTLSENLTQFTDASDISAWAVSAMQWAVGQGLIQGSNGQLRPQANASPRRGRHDPHALLRADEKSKS